MDQLRLDRLWRQGTHPVRDTHLTDPRKPFEQPRLLPDIQERHPRPPPLVRLLARLVHQRVRHLLLHPRTVEVPVGLGHLRSVEQPARDHVRAVVLDGAAAREPHLDHFD